jgi:dTDP-4-dehydrorhamnose 3,5-epimerase
VPFTFEPAPLEGLVLVRPRRIDDARGWFMETFKASEFAAAGIPGPFVQENVSMSKRGTLRGLHFQRPPRGQGKLVTVLSGRVWDVAVDLRPDSSTFGRWYGLELSSADRSSIWIPEGFAHGFLSLEEGTELLYACTAEYEPALEAGVRWNDPDLGIEWPEPPIHVSARDAALPLLRELREGEPSDSAGSREDR